MSLIADIEEIIELDEEGLDVGDHLYLLLEKVRKISESANEFSRAIGGSRSPVPKISNNK